MIKLLGRDWYAPPSGEGGRLLLRGLTGLEMMVAVDMLGKAGMTMADLAAAAAAGRLVLAPDLVRHVLTSAVLGWDGFGDAEGAALPFEIGRVADLPFNVVAEAFGEIIGRSVLDPDTAKNSSSQPKSGSTPTASTAKPAAGAGTATRTTPRVSKNSSFPGSSPAGPA